MSKSERYIQVGVTALRDPATGAFLKSVPMYIKAEDSAEAGEEKLIKDIAGIFAAKMKNYVEGCRKAGVEV